MNHQFRTAGRIIPEQKHQEYPAIRLYAGYYSAPFLIIPITFLLIHGTGFKDDGTYSLAATIIGFWISFLINISFAVYLTFSYEEYFDAPRRLIVPLVGGTLLSLSILILQILFILSWLK